MIRVEHNRAPRRAWRTRILWIIGLLIVLLSLATAGFAAWALLIPSPMPEALAALDSSSSVAVDQSVWLTFSPTQSTPNTGLIFYPGGRVDARAYAPYAHEIADAGYLVVIVPMPLNLAVFAPGSARDVMQEFSGIDRWYIGGHSLGGAMAANFVYANPDCCAGLLLWAAYPADNNDLSSRATFPVVSIYGTRDGLATQDKILDSRVLLPQAARLVPIAGGNHAQFGWYGPQNGDNPAAISHLQQQHLTVSATVELLSQD